VQIVTCWLKMVVRQYNEELKYLEKITPTCWRIKKGFQPNMNVSLTVVRQPAGIVHLQSFQIRQLWRYHVSQNEHLVKL